MKQRENCLRRFNEANISVIDTTNSHIPLANLSISVSECGILYPLIEILDEMFNSASNLLQDPASIFQCPESEGYLAKSQSNPSQPHHIKINKMAALRATQVALSLNPTEYAAIKLQLPKKKNILKNFYGLCDQIKQNSLI